MKFEIFRENNDLSNKKNIILGINAVYHESSAAIIVNGELVAAAEEERFNRKKHGKEAIPTNANEIPTNAISFCLKKAGIALDKVNYIGYSFSPKLRFEKIWPVEKYDENNWGSQAAEVELKKSLSLAEIKLRQLGFVGHFHWIDHELSHAASAYYASPFSSAAILSIDGIGEHNTGMILSGNKNRIKSLEQIHYPNSVGFLWEKMCKFLGFSEYQACKVMGLAGYGNPERFKAKFEKIVTIHPDGLFEINNHLMQFRSEDYSTLEALFESKRRLKNEDLSQDQKDIAAALQDVTNQVMLGLANRAKNMTECNTLCLAGGVALNCVSNSYVTKNGPFEKVFVQPAAHDAGTSMGAALYIWHNILGGHKNGGIHHSYHGPSFTADDYIKTLNQEGLLFESHDNIEEIVATLIANGSVVGWFQGAMEFGPRALGNRSLLADPRNPKTREILNIKVKHRELFRPFAPSVLAEQAENWFELKQDQDPNDFMLLVDPVKADKRALVPSVIHVDGTARIQRVHKETNPKYHSVISEFYKQTGVPLVLNTSFNDEEPIVCTPLDAVTTFKKTAIDYLVLGNFLVDRRRQKNINMESKLV